MKRKTIILSVVLLVVVMFVIAAVTKPTDKQIMIEVVDAMWGDRVPDKQMPEYYAQFMVLTTKNIDIDDLVFVKRIKYTLRDTTNTIGYGAFGKVMLKK